MNIIKALDTKIGIILVSTIIVLAHILWEYYNGGVVTHHLLADENLPGISNWWGCITIPILTWIVLIFTKKRIQKEQANNAPSKKITSQIIKQFLLGLSYGAFLSILWETGQENILQYAILVPLALSFFIKVHFAESLLGLVIGMIYTFGGILPLIRSK